MQNVECILQDAFCVTPCAFFAALMFSDALEWLQAALARPLPGAAAHAVMAPALRTEWPPAFDVSRLRHAAGLLLLYPVDDRAHIVLTVRADALGRHGGQVSLPGGVIDPGETFEQAALREAHEEIALPLDAVRILGALTPLDIPVSGFRLHPIVASAAGRPPLTPADAEVARILEVSVDELLDPSRMQIANRIHDGKAVAVPLLRVGHDEFR